MGTGNLHIMNMMTPLKVSGCQVHMQLVWGGRLAPVLSPIAVRANGSTSTMCCVRSRECVALLVHVVQGAGVSTDYVAADG